MLDLEEIPHRLLLAMGPMVLGFLPLFLFDLPGWCAVVTYFVAVSGSVALSIYDWRKDAERHEAFRRECEERTRKQTGGPTSYVESRIHENDIAGSVEGKWDSLKLPNDEEA